MKQITQKDLINLIEEKQKNAEYAYNMACVSVHSNDKIEEEALRDRLTTNKAYIEAYQDLICYINSVEIVPENRNLAKVYFGKKVEVHTKNRIIGNSTPFEIVGKIISDSGANIRIKAEDGGYAIIDKTDIKSIEIVPDNNLLEPLCNKCSKTNESCPFHRMGSAYEDCGAYEEIVTTIPKAKQEELGIKQEDLREMLEKTPITPYNEPKVEPLRNDRFREFARKNYNDSTSIVTIDAKAVIAVDMTTEKDDKYEVIIVSNCGNMTAKTFIEEPRAKAYYNELVEWWKYWKQN